MTDGGLLDGGGGGDGKTHQRVTSTGRAEEPHGCAAPRCGFASEAEFFSDCRGYCLMLLPGVAMATGEGC